MVAQNWHIGLLNSKLAGLIERGEVTCEIKDMFSKTDLTISTNMSSWTALAFVISMSLFALRQSKAFRFNWLGVGRLIIKLICSAPVCVMARKPCEESGCKKISNFALTTVRLSKNIHLLIFFRFKTLFDFIRNLFQEQCNSMQNQLLPSHFWKQLMKHSF